MIWYDVFLICDRIGSSTHALNGMMNFALRYEGICTRVGETPGLKALGLNYSATRV